jgi:hypothetical protein
MLAEEENFAGLGRLNWTLVGRAEGMDSACRAAPSGGIAEPVAAGKSIWSDQGRRGV